MKVAYVSSLNFQAARGNESNYIPGRLNQVLVIKKSGEKKVDSERAFWSGCVFPLSSERRVAY
jgi:hypothetical protein